MMQRPIKFLCVHQGHELYGSDRMFLQSVAAIKKKWPDAKIIVHLPKMGVLGSYLKQFADRIVCGDLFVLRRAGLQWKNWKNALNFFHSLKVAFALLKESDIIYINTITILNYLIVLFFTRKHFFLHAHESPPKRARFLYSYCLKLSNITLLANSTATKHDFFQSIPSHVILNGLGEALENHKSPTRSNILHLLLPGRLNAWKGQLLAIQAVAAIKDNVALKIIGSMYNENASYLRDMQAMIENLGLTKQIEILNFSNDLSKFYTGTDIVLMPSIKPEPFGLVAIEAMQHGLPVIAANHGGLTEIVEHDKTGLLFKPGDIQALAEAIRYYQDNPEKLVEHGHAGLERYKEKFTSSHYEQDFIEVIEKHVA